MLARSKSKAAAERIQHNCSTDLLADLHIVVDDALKHGEIDRAHVYCNALMKVALGEPAGFISASTSGEKSIRYQRASKKKILAHLPIIAMFIATAGLLINHLSVAEFLSCQLMDRGFVAPSMVIVGAELAIEQATNSTRTNTLGAMADMLNCDGRFNEALALTTETLAKYPADGLVAYNKVVALEYKGRYQEAIDTVQQNLPVVDAYSRDVLNLSAAEVYTYMNDLKNAEASWNAVNTKSRLDMPDAKVTLARINVMQNDPESAQKLLRESLSRRGLRRTFKVDHLRWAQAAFLQADLLENSGLERRAIRLRAKAARQLNRNNFELPPDQLIVASRER